MSRRTAIFRLTYDQVYHLFGQLEGKTLLRVKGLRPGLRIVAVSDDFNRACLLFRVEGNGLVETPDGAPLPELAVEVYCTPADAELARLRSDNDALHGAVADMLEEGQGGAKAFLRGREAERAEVEGILLRAERDAAAYLDKNRGVSPEVLVRYWLHSVVKLVRDRGESRPLPPHRLAEENGRLRAALRAAATELANFTSGHPHPGHPPESCGNGRTALALQTVTAALGEQPS